MSVNIYDKTTKQLTVIAGKNPGDNIVIDQALSISSENPVQNKVISQRLNQLDTSKVGRFSTMPTPSSTYNSEIVQYIGNTTNDYTKGHFYECVYANNTYSWRELPIGSGDTTQYETMPTPAAEWVDAIVQYTGTNDPYVNGFFYKCVLDGETYKWVEWDVMRRIIMLNDVSGANIQRDRKVATIRWSDPTDLEVSGQIRAVWEGTKLVRKIGSAPQNEEDGELIVNSFVRNQYSENGFVDNTLEYDKVYYYRFFPYTTEKIHTKGTAIMVETDRISVPIPTQTGTLTYDGTAQSPTLSNTDYFTISGDTEKTDAGTHELVCTLISDDYKWSDDTIEDQTVEWTIQKASGITPDEASISVTSRAGTGTISFSDLYGRTIISAVSSNTNICTVSTDGEEVTVTYVRAGNAAVTITVNGSDNALQAIVAVPVTCAVQAIYGFQIDGNESDPSAAVTYLSDCDNYGYTPAHMDFTEDEFDYGSWSEDEFFMPRPCMLKFDGTVAYYLDPNDYTKKLDGTDSDVADENFEGNAMMEWGHNGSKIWYKIEPFNNNHSAKIYISNYQVDSDYQDWSFHNCDGVSADHFYTAIYNGSLYRVYGQPNSLRSLSDKTPARKYCYWDPIKYSRTNNKSNKVLWDIEYFADRQLINFLLILMGKSLDIQAVYGKGACGPRTGSGFGNLNSFNSGVHNTKGLFYGTNDYLISTDSYENCVKIFGMENYYGAVRRFTNGYITSNGNQLIKMTYGTEDGSGGEGFIGTDERIKLSNYIDTEVPITSANNSSSGYISKMYFTKRYMIVSDIDGSGSTYCPDICAFSDGLQFAAFGESVAHTYEQTNVEPIGPLAVQFTLGWEYSEYWGACISCKPLKEEEK